MIVLKLLLKIVVAPVVVLLTLFVWICVGLVYVSGLGLGLTNMVIALLGVAVLVIYSPKNGLILLLLAFLIGPFGYTLCPELSWSHYRLLMRVPDEQAQTFYIEECVKSAWSVRQLERQINTMYYQRILASQEKALVSKEILIDHLQHFLLELGRGFSFVARQKRFTLDGQEFFIDLVFYNYIPKCFVLIDLKMGKLTHQDLGQMQMYVNYYTREMMNDEDTQPIGIVLCADKGDSIVKYTLPEDNHQIFSSKYFTYLPSEEELKRELNLDDFYELEE